MAERRIFVPFSVRNIRIQQSSRSFSIFTSAMHKSLPTTILEDGNGAKSSSINSQHHAYISRMIEKFQPWSFNTAKGQWTRVVLISKDPSDISSTSPISTSAPVSPADSAINIISWNLWNGPRASVRASVIIQYLKEAVVSNNERPTIIMLQEVTRDSLMTITNHGWIQKEFVLTDIQPVKKRLASYFTMMLIPRTVEIKSCYRVPFVSDMSRDALVVSINAGMGNRRRCLRLCTTHLESLDDPSGYRSNQLALISSILKMNSKHGRVVFGSVGGDFNSIDPREHVLCRRQDIDLSDAWQDSSIEQERKDEDEDEGKIRPETWNVLGRLPGQKSSCLDKFLSTRSVKVSALKVTGEYHDVNGCVTRLGIGLTTSYLQRQGEGASSDADAVQDMVSDHVGIGVNIQTGRIMFESASRSVLDKFNDSHIF